MRSQVLALAPLVGSAVGIGFHTLCGDMNSHMFAALSALGKTPPQMRFPNSLPNPDLPAGTDTIPGIEHIVYLMMENHSWDNVFGTLNRTGHDGWPRDSLGNPQTMVPVRYQNGSVQLAYEMPKTCFGKSNGPSQNWESSHQQLNNGSMDGWAIGGEQDKPVAMGYYTKDHLPVMHSLAEKFPISDRFFTSTLGQTWPNRMFALAGTARGIIKTGQTDDLIKMTVPNGIIVNKLDDYNVSWINYLPNKESNTGTLRLFPSIIGDLDDKHFKTFPDQFLSDVQEGNLPQFTWIDYNSSVQSMESPENMVAGEQLIWDVVSALMKGPKWDKTALILTFDEHGGFYDHVPPVPVIRPDDVDPIIPSDLANHTGYYEYDRYSLSGFRIPLIMISPYGRKEYVSHVVSDHSSILSFIEHKFNLPAMTCRDANANNLFDIFDFDAMEQGTPNFPASVLEDLLPPSTNPEFVGCTPDNPGVIPPVGSVIEDGVCSGPDFGPRCLAMFS